MKVTSVVATCLAVPIRFPVTDAPYTAGMLVVQVTTDDGLVGTGISRDRERFAVRELIWTRTPLPSSNVSPGSHIAPASFTFPLLSGSTTCAGIDPHAASIFCGANYPRWVALFR